MQPSSPEPTNSTGQLSSSSQSEELFMAQSPDSPGSTDQPYPLSPYPQTESPVVPPPPLGNYPPGEEEYYRQLARDGGPITRYRAQLQEKVSEPAKPQRNGWKIIATILAVLVLMLATTTATLLLTRPSVQQTGRATSPAAATQAVQPAPTSVVTQAVQSTSTSAATQPTPAATTSPPNSYSATQPGPGCDLSGGTWNPAGPIGNIQCGTRITINANQGRGYLYLALPANAAFSPGNTVSIASTMGYDGYTSVNTCGGLAEQDANTGFLVEYCNNGQWSVYSISSAGAIIKTLASGITSTRTNEELSLALSGNTLAFTIDTEVHKLTVVPIQPVKVGIEVYCQGAGNSITVNNFSYLAKSS